MKPGPKTDEPGESFTASVIEARTGANLRESAKAFRDAFCREYIKDFSGPSAMVRCGYQGPRTSANTRSCNLLREPYVANKIDELIRQLKPEDIVTRQQVMALMWKEANDQHNPGKVRVAALAHVATMLGMTRPKEDTGSQPIGVLLIPMVAGDDWALLAAASQKALKQGEIIDGAITYTNEMSTQGV